MSSGCFIGMDEAGYGPNLGPLLLVTTRWETPEAPANCDFYQHFSKSVSATGHNLATCLHVADSKVVFKGKTGFASLERSALALLKICNLPCDSFHAIWNAICPDSAVNAAATTHAPWYQDDLKLPIAADPRQVDRLVQNLQAEMKQTGCRLDRIRGDIVTEQRFNDESLAEGSNKSLALSRLAFRLLRQVWTPDHPQQTVFVGDKHGGRNRYDELLSEVVDGAFISRLEEGMAVSRYQIGATELRFQMRGEAWLPVAAASIVAKYLRELAMDQINAFWQRYLPELKPTRGYPVDAKRFLTDITPALSTLDLPRSQIWRER